MPIETEIKFLVADLAGLTKKLESAGFRLQTPRSFESNVLYDFARPPNARPHRNPPHPRLRRPLDAHA